MIDHELNHHWPLYIDHIIQHDTCSCVLSIILSILVLYIGHVTHFEQSYEIYIGCHSHDCILIGCLVGKTRRFWNWLAPPTQLVYGGVMRGIPRAIDGWFPYGTCSFVCIQQDGWGTPVDGYTPILILETSVAARLLIKLCEIELSCTKWINPWFSECEGSNSWMAMIALLVANSCHVQ